jgi:hypothetical protein
LEVETVGAGLSIEDEFPVIIPVAELFLETTIDWLGRWVLEEFSRHRYPTTFVIEETQAYVKTVELLHANLFPASDDLGYNRFPLIVVHGIEFVFGGSDDFGESDDAIGMRKAILEELRFSASARVPESGEVYPVKLSYLRGRRKQVFVGYEDLMIIIEMRQVGSGRIQVMGRRDFRYPALAVFLKYLFEDMKVVFSGYAERWWELQTTSDARGEPLIVVTQPLPLETTPETFVQWLRSYQRSQHPSRDPSAWFTDGSGGLSIYYHVDPYGQFCFAATTPEAEKLTITRMTYPRHWEDCFKKLIEAIRQRWMPSQAATDKQVEPQADSDAVEETQRPRGPMESYGIKWDLLSEQDRLVLARLGVELQAVGITFQRKLGEADMYAVFQILQHLAILTNNRENHIRFALGDWLGQAEEWFGKDRAKALMLNLWLVKTPAFKLLLETTPDHLGRWLLAEWWEFPPTELLIEEAQWGVKVLTLVRGELIPPADDPQLRPFPLFVVNGIKMTFTETDNLNMPAARKVIISEPHNREPHDTGYLLIQMPENGESYFVNPEYLHGRNYVFLGYETPMVAVEMRQLSSEHVQALGFHDVRYPGLADCLNRLRVKMVRVFKQLGPEEEVIEEIDRELRGAEPKPAETGADESPWERIPDHNWDRQALRLWWEGYTCPEIGDRIHVATKTVLNRLSLLRQEHGDAIVPTNAQRREWGRSGYSG